MMLFDQVFGAVFQSTQLVSTQPPLPPDGPNVAGVLEVTFEDVDSGFRPWTSRATWVELTYRFTLWSAEGKRIASWTVTGTGRPPQSGPRLWPSALGGTPIEAAMQDAARNLLTVIWGVPEFQAWLREVGVEGVPTTSAASASVPPPVPVPNLDTMPARWTEAGVVVGADPYVQAERLKKVFGRDLRKWGALPIQVFLQNRGAQRLWLQRSSIALELPDGSQMTPVRGTKLATMAAPLTPLTAGDVALGTALVPPLVALQLLTGGMVGGLANAAAQDEDMRRRTEYWEKEFKDATLGKDEVHHGFVFFALPQETKAFSEATLVLNIVNLDEGRRLVVRLPLSGLAFNRLP
jgi:hypothetical protein